jgi:hypothetical protein
MGEAIHLQFTADQMLGAICPVVEQVEKAGPMNPDVAYLVDQVSAALDMMQKDGSGPPPAVILRARNLCDGIQD